MKTLHLVTAVLSIIRDFHARKSTFNISDVTKKLRSALNDCNLFLLDAPHGGVTHNIIENIVYELFLNNFILDYKFFDMSGDSEYRFGQAKSGTEAATANDSLLHKIGNVVRLLDKFDNWHGGIIDSLSDKGCYIRHPILKDVAFFEWSEILSSTAAELPVVGAPLSHVVGNIVRLVDESPFQSWNGGTIGAISDSMCHVRHPLTDRIAFFPWKAIFSSVPPVSRRESATKLIAVGDIVTIKDGIAWKESYDGATVTEVSVDGESDAFTIKRADGIDGIIYKEEIESFSTPPAVARALRKPDNTMWAALHSYIDKHPNATLKQMQSRLKGWKVTVKDIAEYFRKTGVWLTSGGNVSERRMFPF